MTSFVKICILFSGFATFALGQTALRVDFGPPGQGLQSEWTGWDETDQSVEATSRVFSLDFGNGSFADGNFRATLTDGSGEAFKVGDRALVPGGGLEPLEELTQDFFRFDNVGGAEILLEGLADGSYTIRIYTNNFPYGSSRINRLRTWDNQTTLATAPDEADVINVLEFEFDIGVGAGPFVASGEPVRFRMNQTGGSLGVANINGFELEQVPAFVLTGEGSTAAALVVADEPLVALKGIGRDPDYTQRSVAEELQTWLEKASGVKVPILSASEVGGEEPLILVGRSAWTDHYGLATPDEMEGVWIRSFPRGVALLGEISKVPATGLSQEQDRGVYHAMHFLLERYLGFRFYFRYAVDGDEDFGISILRRERLLLPGRIDFETSPAFSYRLTDRAGFESWLYRGNPEQRRPVAHPDSGWKNFYRNEHPEYFLMKSDGSRDFRFLDYSEPSVVDQRIENLDRLELSALPPPAAAELRPAVIADSGDDDGFEIRYRREQDRTGLTYRVLVSDDLSGWNHNADGTGLTYTEEFPDSEAHGDGTETVTVRSLRVPEPDAPVFLRVETIREPFNYPGSNPNAVYIPVAPTDNLAKNHHPRALELSDPALNPAQNYEHQLNLMGRQSNLYWSHIKAFAEEVKARWPDRRIETLAYQGYTIPPDFELPDNIDVILANLTPSHLYKEPEAEAIINELVLAWHEKLGHDRDRLRIWDYPNFPGFFTAAPILYPNEKQRLLQNLRPYIAGEYWNSGGRGAQESHWFLNLADRMLWNPDLDVADQLRDYTSNFYGPAGPAMEAFFRLLIDRYEQVEWPGSRDTLYDAGIYHDLYAHTYPPEVIDLLEGHIQEAVAVATGARGGPAWRLKPGETWSYLNGSEERRHRLTIEAVDGLLTNPSIRWRDGELTYRGELYGGMKLVVESGPDGVSAKLYPVDLTDDSLSEEAPAGGSEGTRQVVEWLRTYAHPGGRYRVSVTARTEGGGEARAILYYDRFGDGTFGHDFFRGEGVFGEDWTEVTDTFTVPLEQNAFNRLDLFRMDGTVYFAGMSLKPDLPEDGIDVSDRIDGAPPVLAANEEATFLFSDDQGHTYAEALLTLEPIIDAERAALYEKRVLWILEWLEDFVPETRMTGGERSAKSGFFVEARQAQEWIDRDPIYPAGRVTNPPAADFADPVWQAAPATELRYGLDAFSGSSSTPFNRMGFTADLPTRIRAVHDTNHLFIAVKAYQRHAPEPEDKLGFAFFDDQNQLLKFDLHADGLLAGAEGIEVEMAQGTDWWGAFLKIPVQQLGATGDDPLSLRANFTRFRTWAPGEADGSGSDEDDVELPMPPGAVEPSLDGDGVRYTWSPALAGGLGWNGFPWFERGVFQLE